MGMAKCNNCCLIRLGSVFIVLTVLVAAVVAASECAFCIVTSSFCHHADKNVLSYAQKAFGTSTDEYGAVRFYITGEETNPINQLLSDGKAELVEANTKLNDLVKQYGKQVWLLCKGWKATDIQNGFQTMMDTIDSS